MRTILYSRFKGLGKEQVMEYWHLVMDIVS